MAERRVLEIQRRREMELRRFEQQRAKFESDVQAGLGMHLKEKFATQGVTFEAELKKDTVGLVTFDEFHQKRTDLEDKFAEQARLKQQQELERKRKAKRVDRGRLSFAVESDEEEEAAAEVRPKKKITAAPGSIGDTSSNGDQPDAAAAATSTSDSPTTAAAAAAASTDSTSGTSSTHAATAPATATSTNSSSSTPSKLATSEPAKKP